MQSLKAVKAVLTPDCYALVAKVVCIMLPPYCTSDGYLVRMYNYDICVAFLKCSAVSFSEDFVGDMCYDLTSKHSNQAYNGTDHFTYKIMDEEEEKKETTGGTTPLFDIGTMYVITFTLTLQHLSLNYHV